jgi:hypothetical protein
MEGMIDSFSCRDDLPYHRGFADPRSNVLLVFIPIGWALHFVKDAGNTSISDTAVFCTTFISIIPLGECGSECTECTAACTSESDSRPSPVRPSPRSESG